jgi:hypothetical protein
VSEVVVKGSLDILKDRISERKRKKTFLHMLGPKGGSLSQATHSPPLTWALPEDENILHVSPIKEWRMRKHSSSDQ